MNVQARSGRATRLIERIEFETDAGIAARARLGLIVLATDYTIEHEFRAVLARVPGVALYASRLWNDTAITPRTLAAMEGRIRPAAELLLPGDRFDVVAFGCTSASMVLGEARVFELIGQAKPEARATTPVTAAFAAFRAFGARRIGVLAPYPPEVNATVQRYVEAAGFEIPVFGSFNEGHDPTVAAISPASLRAAARRVADRRAFRRLHIAAAAGGGGVDRGRAGSARHLFQPRHHLALPAARRCCGQRARPWPALHAARGLSGRRPHQALRGARLLRRPSAPSTSGTNAMEAIAGGTGADRTAA
jgi:maleate isomerase